MSPRRLSLCMLEEENEHFVYVYVCVCVCEKIDVLRAAETPNSAPTDNITRIPVIVVRNPTSSSLNASINTKISILTEMNISKRVCWMLNTFRNWLVVQEWGHFCISYWIHFVASDYVHKIPSASQADALIAIIASSWRFTRIRAIISKKQIQYSCEIVHIYWFWTCCHDNSISSLGHLWCPSLLYFAQDPVDVIMDACIDGGYVSRSAVLWSEWMHTR